MSSKVTITWLGHSCYRFVCGDYSWVMDPYEDDSVPGYGKVRTTANAVFCTHGHSDHSNRAAVTIVDGEKKPPFTLTKVTCPHDDAGGSKRGMNQMHIFDFGDLRIGHLGDVGCPLTKEQLAAVGKLDAAIVPVGGYFTMEPAGIAELVKQLEARVVIPCHYRSETFGYPTIGTLDAYLACVDGDVVHWEGNQVVITPDSPMPQTAILQYLG